MNNDTILNANKVTDSGLFDYVNAHPVLSVLIVLIAIVALFLIIRLCFKIFGAFRNQKEVASLRKDLMVWSVLSSLVHGGKKTDKAKAELNSRLAALTANFEHILGILRAQKYIKHRRPWFVLVGEPSNGKSSLVTHCDLEFKCSESDKDDKRQPIRFFYNNSSVIADVPGRVFFDSWLGGSSAEWSHIGALLRKYNAHKPLDGVILTVSADSLLADDHKLTQKKAQLIADELLRLSGQLHMHLPCYLIVTKLDNVVGFREYFLSLEGEAKDQIFGYQPLTDSSDFRQDEFADFFDALILRLGNGAVGLMSSKEAMELSYTDRSRMDLTGNIYLFPEAFSKLRSNLECYLETIFTKQGVGVEPGTNFKGVYFTSSEDQGFCYDERFAEFQHKSMDDAPLYDNNFKQSRAYFISELLSHMVLRPQRDAVFTKSERLRRRIPALTACVTSVALACFYLYGACFEAPVLLDRLEYDRLYYVDLTDQFSEKQINGAPLLGVDYRGQGVLFINSPMPDDPKISRMNFFSDAHERMLRKIRIPLSFFPASMIKFGWSRDPEIAQRTFLYNQLQTNMAFLPLVASVENSFVERAQEPMSLEKREALFELMQISLFSFQNHTPMGNDVYKPNTMQAFLNYLYPQVSDSLRTQISDFKAGHDYLAQSTNRTIVLDPQYDSSCAIGLRSLLENWQNLSNYPTHEYSRLKGDISAANRLMDVAQRLDELRRTDVMSLNLDQMRSVMDKYRTWASQFYTELGEINDMIQLAAVQTRDLTGKHEQKNESNGNQYYVAFESSYQGYRSLLNEDFNYLVKFGQDQLASGISPERIAVWGDLGEHTLNIMRGNIAQSLESEHQRLTRTLIKVQQDPLFQHVDDKRSNSDLNFSVIGDMLKLSLISTNTRKIKSPDDINEMTKQVDAEVDHAKALVTEKYEEYSSSQLIKQWASFCISYIDLQHTVVRLGLVQQILDLYPYTPNDMNLLSDISIMVADYQGQGSGITSSVSFDMINEILGKTVVRQEYNPDGFVAYSSTIAALRAYSMDKKYPYFSHAVGSNSQLQRLVRIFQKYAGSYFNYWAHFVQNIHPKADSYAEFYALLNNTRAYQVNSQLQDLYDMSFKAVNAVSDDLLDEGGLSQKKATLKLLDAKSKSLDIEFTDSCNNEVAAWSELSDDATYANRKVMAMDEKDIRNTLQLLSRSNISWWSEFTALGSRLLKRDASSEASTSVAMYQGDLKVFPLIKDGDPHKQILSKNDMRALMAMFKSFGLSAKTDAEDPLPDELAGFAQGNDNNILHIDKSLKAPLVFSEDSGTQAEFKSWSKTMENLLTVLSTADRSSYYKLNRVGAVAQQRLAKEQGLGGYESGITRYRYFDVRIGKQVRTERMSSFVNVAEPENIARGSLDNQEITFRFYRFSDATEPDCTYVIDGGYPALQLYLSENAVYDDESKMTYVPLFLKDENGSRSVFYIALSTAVKLPPAASWPSLLTWPDLTLFNDRSN